ncbi:hypothetical protein [Oleiharenicola lentus]|uniref:hypothetical protein n=1 Tax=Oleiharenicola lentus TaxID=2508720 RepID=UPI003F67C910
MIPILTSHEAKLLYSLLDAADDDGRLDNSPFSAVWQRLKKETVKFRPADRAELFQLLTEIEKKGLLENTWMEEHWLRVKNRVDQKPMAFSPTSPPFPENIS